LLGLEETRRLPSGLRPLCAAALDPGFSDPFARALSYTLGAEDDAARAFGDYRALYLDRSRARYEQEMQTDLGDAMVELSEARLRSARVRFERAMAWARLRALGGAPAEALSADLFGKTGAR